MEILLAPKSQNLVLLGSGIFLCMGQEDENLKRRETLKKQSCGLFLSERPKPPERAAAGRQMRKQDARADAKSSCAINVNHSSILNEKHLNQKLTQTNNVTPLTFIIMQHFVNFPFIITGNTIG